MDDQLQQLINLQKEQNELLKKYLWRLRFSILSLLVLTTAIAIGLGIVVYQTRPQVKPTTPVTPFMPLKIRAAPSGDIEVLPEVPGTT